MAPSRRSSAFQITRRSRNGPPKRAFRSSRLNEPQIHAEDGQDVSEQSAVEEAPSVISSGEGEEEETFQPKADSYNALLLSLKSAGPVNEAARKKRKLSRKLLQNTSIAPANDGLLSSDIGIDLSNRIDQPMEGEREAQEESDDADDDTESEEDVVDPFQEHFNMLDGDKLRLTIQGLGATTTASVKVQDHWKVAAVIADSADSLWKRQLETDVPFLVKDLNIKEKLSNRARKQLALAGKGIAGTFAKVIFGYSDLFFCGRSRDNRQTLQNLWCLHALNHVLKTRDRILKNTARLKADISEALEYRDQGFTRPKVLILLPTRQACARVVESIVSLYEPEQQENKKRFTESYSQDTEDISEDKPADFHDLFGGNDDDLFRLGLKFTRKAVKFFSQFYSSDIIFASPLGLRMAVGAEDSRKQDFDFLSSIELVIVDHADALLMQNWEHVEYIFDHLNLQPKEAHDCDFSRVRSWYLDGNAKYVRQTILLSSFNTPELNQLVSRHMRNVRGRLKITPDIRDAAVLSLGVPIKQTFVRIDVPEPQKDPEARFSSFTSVILPSLTKLAKAGTTKTQGVLIFIPSYMDFVRVRNFLANSVVAQNISFGSISEYTAAPDVARARSHFLTGRHAMLLYSGRSHHFRRYKIRGVKRVIMYALPDNPLFYKEIAGEFLARSISEGLVIPEEADVKSLFSKWDVLKMERVVGTQRLRNMLKESRGDTFDFI